MDNIERKLMQSVRENQEDVDHYTNLLTESKKLLDIYQKNK